jgi:hypothetical protein
MGEPKPPDAAERLWQWFTSTLLAPFSENRKAAAATVGMLALLAAPLLLSSHVYVNSMIHDLFIPLDSALRMSQGQWPHVDFYTPIGAGYYVVLGLAASLVGTGVSVVPWAAFLPAPLIAGAAWWAGRTRLASPFRMALVAYLALLMFSPRTLGAMDVSYLATYNKHGWALAGLVAFIVLIQPAQRSRRDANIEGAILAFATLFAFYLKVTYFGLCGAFLLYAFVANRGQRLIAFGAGASTLGVLGLISLVTNHNARYLADLQRAAASVADPWDLARPERVMGILGHNQAILLGMFVFAIWLVRSSADQESEARASTDIIRLIVLVGLSILITLQSHDYVVPTLPIIALGCVDIVRRRYLEQGLSSSGAMNVVAAAAMALICTPIGMDVVAIGNYAGSRLSSEPLHPTMSRMNTIRVPRSSSPSSLERMMAGEITGAEFDNSNLDAWPQDTGPIFADAIELIDRHNLREAAIGSLTFEPAFPWLLEGQPPLHQPAWLDHGRTFSATSTGPLDQQLDQLTVVLVPKVWNIAGVWTVYGPTIEADFVKLDETPLWTLWLRDTQ